MIVPMKKLLLVCLKQDREQMVGKLRDLGVMHILQTQKPESSELSKMERSLADVTQAINHLNAQKKISLTHEETYTPEEVLALSLNAIDHITALKLKLDNILKDIERLEPWGNFNYSQIRHLEEKGVHLYLCESTHEKMVELKDKYDVFIVRWEKKRVYYVVASLDPISVDTLPVTNVPDYISLEEALKIEAVTRSHINTENENLMQLAKHAKSLESIRQQRTEDVTYQSAMCALQDVDQLAWMQGFIPAEQEESVKTFAKSAGCAVSFTDPAEDEFVPTFLRIPKYARMVKPLFDFIGILPGYREWDVAVCLLFFFSVFFAMIINDAGYGSLFFIISVVGLICFKKNKKAIAPLQLFLILSVFAIVWGALNGSWFGIPETTLEKMGLGCLVSLGDTLSFYPPWVKNIKDFYNLPAADIKQLNLEYLCFFIALIHLSIARIWKFCFYLKKKQILTGISQLGWVAFLIGNFFMAVDFVIFPGSRPDFVFPVYIGGFVLIAMGVKWNDVGDIFNLPFSLINSFVDTLSYIRLFAVGLAGAYIAVNFNNIAVGLIDIHPVFIVATIIILLAGHVLNIALCLMGVMVHAIRLNALEFSNHMGLEWTGTEYAPLKRENPLDDASQDK